jgi:hypothetical protein
MNYIQYLVRHTPAVLREVPEYGRTYKSPPPGAHMAPERRAVSIYSKNRTYYYLLPRVHILTTNLQLTSFLIPFYYPNKYRTTSTSKTQKQQIQAKTVIFLIHITCTFLLPTSIVEVYTVFQGITLLYNLFLVLFCCSISTATTY